jgi:hypothetical protein
MTAANKVCIHVHLAGCDQFNHQNLLRDMGVSGNKVYCILQKLIIYIMGKMMIYYDILWESERTSPPKKNHISSLSLVPHANRHVVPPKPSAASTPVDRSEEQQDGNTGHV